jgi:hypothetical protein
VGKWHTLEVAFLDDIFQVFGYSVSGGEPEVVADFPVRGHVVIDCEIILHVCEKLKLAISELPL